MSDNILDDANVPPPNLNRSLFRRSAENIVEECHPFDWLLSYLFLKTGRDPKEYVHDRECAIVQQIEWAAQSEGRAEDILVQMARTIIDGQVYAHGLEQFMRYLCDPKHRAKYPRLVDQLREVVGARFGDEVE